LKLPVIIPAAVAALSLVGLLRGAYLHFVSEPMHEPVRERIDLRYARLKAMLPAGGAVGYVSDLPAARHPSDNPSSPGTRLLEQAQYALAPIVLRYQDVGAPLVVANLDDPGRLQEVAQRYGLAVVVQAGPGLAVLRPR
jgi:hypothetical protein